MDSLLILLASGGLIVFGSLLASAVAEALQYHYSDTFIAAIIALLQTLPEYAFVVVLTIKGEAQLAIASIIGANILLIGLGFPLVVFIGYLAKAKGIREDKSLDLMRENSIESIFLAISGAYMIYMGFKGYIDMLDSIILLGMFIVYIFAVTRLPPEIEVEKPHGLARYFLNRKKLSAIMIVVSILLIWYPAELFTDKLVGFASGWLNPVLLVAFVAPLVSEMPEKLTAYIGATKNEDMARLGICNFMSSKINNGTLLFSSMFIVAYATGISNGIAINSAQYPHLDYLLILAGFLTLLAAFTTIDRRITMAESFILIILYAFLIHALAYQSELIYAIIITAFLAFVIAVHAIKDKRFLWLSDLKYSIESIKRRGKTALEGENT